MRVTAIKQQVKNKERASIFLDGKYSFSLSLNDLVSEKLKVGLELDEPQLAALRKKSDDGKLKMRALEWVLGRPHSIKEFRDYLRRKQAETELIDKLVEDFETKGYLNDLRFATWWQERRTAKNKSNRAISSELMSKGITRETIDEVFGVQETSENDRLKELIQKLTTRPRYQDHNKLKAYLVRQGYSYSVVKEVLEDG